LHPVWQTPVARLSGRIRACGQNKLKVHLFGEEALMSASKTNRPKTPARLIAIRPQGRQERSEVFFSDGMDQKEADDQHHRAGYAMN
jgi:hypothetical protein